VQFEGAQASVFLIAQDPKGKIARRTTVQTGLSSDGYVEIVSGLKAGDHIVADGLNRIQDGAPSAAVTARAIGRPALERRPADAFRPFRPPSGLRGRRRDHPLRHRTRRLQQPGDP
jgi:hypothetical protein